MKLELFVLIIEKYSNLEFHENPSSGSRTVPCGQTDRHDGANSSFTQLCEVASKVKQVSVGEDGKGKGEF